MQICYYLSRANPTYTRPLCDLHIVYHIWTHDATSFPWFFKVFSYFSKVTMHNNALLRTMMHLCKKMFNKGSCYIRIYIKWIHKKFWYWWLYQNRRSVILRLWVLPETVGGLSLISEGIVTLWVYINLISRITYKGGDANEYCRFT